MNKMKDMQEAMRKVLNVNKLICVYICLLIFGCSSSKESFNKNFSNYTVNKFKSDRRSIKINALDKGFPYDTIPSPLIIINNLYFGETSFFRPKVGKHNIEIASPGKVSVIIKDLVVKKGDSIVINAYLKDDPTPIVD